MRGLHVASPLTPSSPRPPPPWNSSLFPRSNPLLRGPYAYRTYCDWHVEINLSYLSSYLSSPPNQAEGPTPSSILHTPCRPTHAGRDVSEAHTSAQTRTTLNLSSPLSSPLVRFGTLILVIHHSLSSLDPAPISYIKYRSRECINHTRSIAIADKNARPRPRPLPRPRLRLRTRRCPLCRSTSARLF